MRSTALFCIAALAVCLGSPLPAGAFGPDPGKYPLRVYIFRFKPQPAQHREPKHVGDMEDYVSGFGQADLFENGQPLGFQFSYSCIVPMRASGGYATYPARWKKRGKTLEILLPQPGKPENDESCELQPEMGQDMAYYWKDGNVAIEPAAKLKAWMTAHKFDPEQGSEEPVVLPGENSEADPLLAPE